ncbi:VOC family protein [Krasilnikovia sp. MM14-A1004]|uniref:VOC family protein n=1 Tax=Krasilnikovia sp. MM14-A1004 TaxID=3373541 RepID=UPI00399CBE67
MITGAHAILFSADADQDRAFLRDKLGFTGVDAGGGWLIFALPPAEVAVHPGETQASELYLMCDDVNATIAELRGRGVDLSGEVQDRGWGLLTSIPLPSGAQLGLYEPRHPTAPH